MRCVMSQHSAPSLGRRTGRFPVRRQYSLISDLKDGGKERYFSELFCYRTIQHYRTIDTDTIKIDTTILYLPRYVQSAKAASK